MHACELTILPALITTMLICFSYVNEVSRSLLRPRGEGGAVVF